MNMHKICANINYGSLNKGNVKCNLFEFLAINPIGKRKRSLKNNICCCASTEGQMRQKLIMKVATQAALNWNSNEEYIRCYCCLCDH